MPFFDTHPMYIMGAQRTPIGKYNGQFSSVAAPALGAAAITGVINRTLRSLPTDVALASPPPLPIQRVTLGCVLSAGLGQAPARQAALLAGLPVQTACSTLNRVCGSSLEAIISACHHLACFPHDTVIAGGMENMTLAPYLLPASPYQEKNYAPYIDCVQHSFKDGLQDACSRLTQGTDNSNTMGELADAFAQQHGISREVQDAYACASVKKTQQAYQAGVFDNEIIPCHGAEKDEGILALNTEKIPMLRPAFTQEGTITAASSSKLADGAAALWLAHGQHHTHFPFPPLARIVGYHSVSMAPSDYLMAPVVAITALLKQCNWTVPMVDFFEINEAFALLPILAMRQLSIPDTHLNPHGGLALGHPLGASGARILVTLIHTLLSHPHTKRGIASVCIGGGEAIAIAITRPDMTD